VDESIRQATRLWTLAQPTVSSFVASMVRDFRDRDDVLQDIAVAVVESFERWDPERSFVAWAIGIARNQVGLYLRKRRRDARVLEFDSEVMDRLEIAFVAAATDEIPKLDFLQDCLKSLEGRARAMFELRYQQDLKPSAIAASLGMTANGVAKSLQRVRDQLRECVELRAASQGGAS